MHLLSLRSSSADAKNALAVFRISLARFNSANSILVRLDLLTLRRAQAGLLPGIDARPVYPAAHGVDRDARQLVLPPI